MSIKVLTWVFNESEVEGSDRLVLLALADNAEDDHWTCYPSIPTIARKARVSDSTVRRSLKSLVALGAIDIIKHGGPAYRGDRRPNLYKIHRLDGVSDCDPVSVDNSPRGVNLTKTGCQSTAHGVSLVTQEPSFSKPSLTEPRESCPQDLTSPHSCELCDAGWIFDSNGNVVRCPAA